ncbi:VOC family protein [Streptomyces mirabilis]|uniref:VOC family protein n=1 Tax=Streptomyces mirabilis TaxID=68239 RepID=UPI003687DBA0
MDNQALDDFLTAAVTEYQLITPRTPLPCFALLLGHAGRATDGSCFLSDGHLSLALIKHRLDGDTPLGMNHFRFHVTDTEATSAALVEAGADKPAERFTDRPFAEYRAMDPEGNWFDLSAHGFGGPPPPSTPDET